MKRVKILLVALFAALTVCATSAVAFADETSGGGYTVTYNVFAYETRTRTVESGGKAEKLPFSEFHCDVREGTFADEMYTLTWYTDPEFKNEYDFGAVTGDVTIYGKLGETTALGEYGGADAFGWHRDTADVYYNNNELEDKKIIGLSCVNPVEVDETDGTATFALSTRDCSVNYNGIDVSKPFSISLDFGDVNNFYGESCISLGLYNSLSIAQLSSSLYPIVADKYGNLSPYNNTGYMAMLEFWLNINAQSDAHKNQIGKVRNTGTYSRDASPRTVWVDTDTSLELAFCNELKAILERDSAVTFDVYIGETESYAEINGRKFVEMECKRSDFPSGRAYFTVLAECALDVKVKLSQDMGNATATVKSGDKHVTVSSIESKNGFAVADVKLADGYSLKATINGTEVVMQKLDGNKYAIGMPYKFMTEDYTVEFSAVSQSGSSGNKKGCGSAVTATSAVSLAALLLTVAATVILVRRKKGVKEQ